MAKLVSKTYGDALFAVAIEEDRLDEFLDAAKTVAEVFRENGDFGKLLCHPKMTKQDKVETVEEIFGERIPKEFIGLLRLMVEKNREKDISSVLDYFVELVKKEKKIGSAEVVTAISLSEAQKKQIEKKLLDTTDYRLFEMNYEVDPTLIGGMVVRIDDRVVDSSIRTKLHNLSRELRNIRV